MNDIRSMINKRAGMNVAHNLQEANPTEVKEWIPTGSRWLDSIIRRGNLAGIPVGKVIEIAGLESSVGIGQLMNVSDFPDLSVATAEKLCPVEVFHEPLLVRPLQVTFFELHDQVNPMGEANGPQVRTINGFSELEDFRPAGGDSFTDTSAD